MPVKYLYNNRNITIPDDFITNAVHYLNITKDQAVTLYLQDTKKADENGNIIQKSTKLVKKA